MSLVDRHMENNIIWTCQAWLEFRQHHVPVTMTPVALKATWQTKCKPKARTNINFNIVRGRMLECSHQSDEKREKEKFWTVVIDTINYID